MKIKKSYYKCRGTTWGNCTKTAPVKEGNTIRRLHLSRESRRYQSVRMKNSYEIRFPFLLNSNMSWRKCWISKKERFQKFEFHALSDFCSEKRKTPPCTSWWSPQHSLRIALRRPGERVFKNGRPISEKMDENRPFNSIPILKDWRCFEDLK